jgi:hypothetical protein
MKRAMETESEPAEQCFIVDRGCELWYDQAGGEEASGFSVNSALRGTKESAKAHDRSTDILNSYAIIHPSVASGGMDIV